MPTMWKSKKLKKSKSEKSTTYTEEHDSMRRLRNNDVLYEENNTLKKPELLPRSKSATSHSSKSPMKITNSPEHYTLGRHYMRRPAVIQPPSLTTSSSLDISNNFLTVLIESGTSSFRRMTKTHIDTTIEHLLLTLFAQEGIDIEDLTQYSITANRGGHHFPVQLDYSSEYYMAHTIELKLQCDDESAVFDIDSDSPDTCSMMTVENCLRFFEENGLIEIPSLVCRDDEDSFHLPRVEPLDQIALTWEDLPIDPEIRSSLSYSEISQQQAIWELIATEHSFLRQLEVIINLYMRTLELIRRHDLLTEVNYHNIFGYMEEIHMAHEQFWSCTLLPCLEKTLNEHCPLDINVIIFRFPTEFSSNFEVYEQHCAFETTNLRALNEAMNHADFRTYVEWCESHPECHRLKLKDFLAKPMQRLTKYKLLFKAILKKTTEYRSTEELKQIMEEVSSFVDSVNNVLKAQAETGRVEEVMKKISGYAPVEVPGDLKDLIHPHTHLDLMAPMPDVDITKPRILVLEGKLRFRDHKDRMVVHVFLFSDMLLVTKAVKDNYIVVKPPHKISNLQVELRGNTICCIVLTEFRVYSTFFTLKAHSPSIAKEWMDQISSTQDFYDSTITKKVPTWHILESLRQERILHGISQDLLADPCEMKLSAPSPFLGNCGFRRVVSNDSTLSSNSSSAFPFDLQIVPSPKEKRRETLPARTASEPYKKFRSNSITCTRLNSTTSTSNPFSPESTEVNSAFLHPSSSSNMWRRTSSFNTLTEKESARTNYRQHTHSSINICETTMVDAATQTEDELYHRRRRPKLAKAAQVSQESYYTDSDDESLQSPPHDDTSPVENCDPHIHSIIKRHKRAHSNPLSIKFNTSYILDTDTAELDDTAEEVYHTHTQKKNSVSSCGESTLSSFSEQGQLMEEGCSNGSSSLMSEIIKELSKTDSDVSKKLKDFEMEQRETGDIFVDVENSFEKKRQRSMSLYSNFGSLEKRFNMRRSAIQLTNILESTDEDSNSTTFTTPHFLRNTKLRRSKSTFELSFNRRMKPPSPLTTHMKRSSEKIPDICLQVSTPLSSKSKSFDNFSERHSITLDNTSHNNNEEDDTFDSNEERKKLPRTRWLFPRRSKQISPTHNKWSLFKNKAISMESGINNPEYDMPPVKYPSITNSKSFSASSIKSKPILKKLSLSSSRRIMFVVASDSKLV